MWSYLFLGVIQGITEWLPISSQGVVALLSRFIEIGGSEIDIALFLHLGTAGAVLYYFRDEWRKLFSLSNPRLLKFLIISTSISLLIGFPLYHLVRYSVVGPMLLVVTGIGLLFTSFLHRKRHERGWSFNRLTYVAGILQGLAVIPGFSRSGATIFGLSLGKLSPTQILKISYLMSVPVVLASSAYLVLENPSLVYQGWPALITSFGFGLITLKLLLKFSQEVSFTVWALVFALLCFIGAFISYLFI
jgi:undecaprenyl-diphosphatase